MRTRTLYLNKRVTTHKSYSTVTLGNAPTRTLIDRTTVEHGWVLHKQKNQVGYVTCCSNADLKRYLGKLVHLPNTKELTVTLSTEAIDETSIVLTQHNRRERYGALEQVKLDGYMMGCWSHGLLCRYYRYGYRYITLEY